MTDAYRYKLLPQQELTEWIPKYLQTGICFLANVSRPFPDVGGLYFCICMVDQLGVNHTSLLNTLVNTPNSAIPNLISNVIIVNRATQEHMVLSTEFNNAYTLNNPVTYQNYIFWRVNVLSPLIKNEAVCEVYFSLREFGIPTNMLALSDLTDVNISGPLNNQVLTWNTITNRWINAPVPTVSPSIQSTTTVQYQYVPNIATPAVGQFSFVGSDFYFHNIDYSGRNCGVFFQYVNDCMTKSIPIILRCLQKAVAGIIPSTTGTCIITPPVWKISTAIDAIGLQNATVYTLDIRDINNEFGVFNGGNATQIGNTFQIGTTTDIATVILNNNLPVITVASDIASINTSTVNLPSIAQGTRPHVLYFDNNSGSVTYDIPGGGGGDILNNGNSFGAPVVIGSNDNQSVALEVNGANRFVLNTDGSSVFKNTSIVQMQSDSNFIFQNSSGLNNALIVHPDNSSIQMYTSNITMTAIADVQTSKILYWNSLTGAVTRGDLPATAINILDGGNPNTSAISFGPTQLNCLNQWADAHNFIGLNGKSLFKYRQIQYGAAPVVQQVWQQLQPDTYQFIYNCSEPTVGGVEGTIFSLAGGNTNQSPEAKGGYIGFVGGACYTVPNVSLLNPAYWGDILFTVGNYGANGRNLRMSGSRSGVLQIETGTGIGFTPAYETLCTQPQDIPNNAYIALNYLRSDLNNTAPIVFGVTGGVIGMSNSVAKVEIQASDSIITTIGPTSNYFIDDGANTFFTIDTTLNATTVGTNNLLAPFLLNVNTSDILYYNTSTGAITYGGQAAAGKTGGSFTGNASSSGNTNDTVFVNGTIGVYPGQTAFSFNGFNSTWTYTGTTTREFQVHYSVTMASDSTDMNLEFAYYLNDTGDTNPTGTLVAQSTCNFQRQNGVNFRYSVGSSFVLTLAQNDTLRLFVTNSALVANPIVVEKHSVVITAF